MECKINWLASSGMAFMAETGTGHILNMDGAPEAGGRNLAPRPMELMLAGAGGCTAFDVVLIGRDRYRAYSEYGRGPRGWWPQSSTAPNGINAGGGWGLYSLRCGFNPTALPPEHQRL